MSAKIKTLSAIALFLVFGFGLKAQQVVVNNAVYEIIDREASLIDGKSCEGDLVVASAVEYDGNMYPVTSIAKGACAQNMNLISVTIPGSVATICASSFSGCNLSQINLSEGLERIEEWAFSNNRELTEIVLPETVTYIGASSFLNTAATNEYILIYSRSSTPPVLENDFLVNCYYASPFGCVGLSVDDNTIKAYIPKGSYDAYREASIWSVFNQLIETEEWPTLSVSEVSEDSPEVKVVDGRILCDDPVAVYNIDGQPIENNRLPQGVYVVKVATEHGAKSIKVLVK